MHAIHRSCLNSYVPYPLYTVMQHYRSRGGTAAGRSPWSVKEFLMIF
jgi:hypothetical protein